MRRWRPWIYLVPLFIAVAVLVLATRAYGAPANLFRSDLNKTQIIRLDTTPPSWKEFRDRPWQEPRVLAYDAKKPWRIGTLEKKYSYLSGMPIERDLLLSFESGRFHFFYDALTYRWVVSGVQFEPLIGENKLGHTSALVVGIKIPL